VPSGVRKIICRYCKIPVLMAPAHEDVIRQRGNGSRVILLEPWPRPGRGGVTFTRDGLARFTRFPADWTTHQCPARIRVCKYCSAAVLVLHQPPDAAEQLAVLEPVPVAAGAVVIDANGHAVDDRDFGLPGERYFWHSHRARRASPALLAGIPGGAR
jgi:hypothetical protein